MKYSEIIIPEREFTRSVNIQFDTSDDEKLGRFIPNETTIRLLKDYFVDIINVNSNSHSRILYGSYGTGKSHFLTVLCDLLGKYYTSGTAYEKFVGRVEAYDEFLADKIRDFSENGKPYIIVPIVYDYDDFNRCISKSLSKRLKELGLDIKLSGEYGKALEFIYQWANNPESADRFRGICKSHHIDYDVLCQSLKDDDVVYFDAFKDIFKEMTYGMDFMYEPTNMLDGLDSANSAISDDYSGIVFVFDEFGRYIEDNIKKIKVKQIQDLAEYCDHGRFDTHLILVSHKEISQYTKNISSRISDEWKKVEGRFTSSSMNSGRNDQSLSLLNNILIKDKTNWEAFVERYSDEFESMRRDMVSFDGFLVSSDGESPAYASFPLHPIVLYALDKLARKIAQNERTFFTYLSGNERYSLSEFLENNDTESGFHYIGLDGIFDYFEPTFTQNPSEICYAVYRNYRQALSKVKSMAGNRTVEKSVLKAMAVIQIVDEPDLICANDFFLNCLLDFPEDQIDAAIKNLSSGKIIKWTRVYGQYVFYEASSIDIDKLIEEHEDSITFDSVLSYLNSDFVDFVVYPHRYNAEYKIKRVFVPAFVSDDEVISGTIEQRIPATYDGVVAYVLCGVNCDMSALMSAANGERIIYALNLNVSELVDEVKKYIAICSIESTSGDLIFQEAEFINEINFYKKEQSLLISQLIDEWKDMRDSGSYAVCIAGRKILPDGGLGGLKRICDIASDMMEDAYGKTLIVNNDLLNKNSITGAMNTAERAVIDRFIEGCSEEDYYGLPFLSAEYTCFRSVIARNGYYKDASIKIDERAYVNALEVRGVFERFIEDAKRAPQKFSNLYNELKAEPYGLRSGYIPLLFSYFLKEYTPYLVVQFYGDDQYIDSKLFEELVACPNSYTIAINMWSGKQMEFIKNLEDLFEDDMAEKSTAVNRLRRLYDAMCTHYRGISKYARQTKNVSSEAAQYREIIEGTHKDYNKFFFEELTLLDTEKDYDGIFMILEEVKNELDNDVMNKLRGNLIGAVGEVIGKTMNFIESLQPLYEKLTSFYNEKCKDVVRSFDYYANTFIQFCKSLNKPIGDNSVVARLGKLFTGLDLEFWSDNSEKQFDETVESTIETIANYKETPVEAEDVISLTMSVGGEDSTTSFARHELSVNAKTAKNKINATIDNFGLSISYEEKIQIILDVLDEQMRKK